MRFEKKTIRKIITGKQTELRLPAGDELRCRHRPGGLIPVIPVGQRRAVARLIVVRAERDGAEWVVTIVVDRSEPLRMLHRDSSHGYTSNRHEAMPNEPEAVDELTQRRISDRALEESERLRVQRRRDLDQRLRRARDDAQTAGVDITRQESAIERHVQAIERKAGRKAA